MDAVMSLDQLVDESDPDVDFPNSFHAFQTAEGIRREHPDNGTLVSWASEWARERQRVCVCVCVCVRGKNQGERNASWELLSEHLVASDHRVQVQFIHWLCYSMFSFRLVPAGGAHSRHRENHGSLGRAPGMSLTGIWKIGIQITIVSIFGWSPWWLVSMVSGLHGDWSPDWPVSMATGLQTDWSPRWPGVDVVFQWAVVGDTFPVGCRFQDSIVFRENSFLDNPNSSDPVYR